MTYPYDVKQASVWDWLGAPVRWYRDYYYTPAYERAAGKPPPGMDFVTGAPPLRRTDQGWVSYPIKRTEVPGTAGKVRVETVVPSSTSSTSPGTPSPTSGAPTQPASDPASTAITLKSLLATGFFDRLAYGGLIGGGLGIGFSALTRNQRKNMIRNTLVGMLLGAGLGGASMFVPFDKLLPQK